MQDCNAGLCFCNEAEADQYFKTMTEKLLKLQPLKKKSEKAKEELNKTGQQSTMNDHSADVMAKPFHLSKHSDMALFFLHLISNPVSEFCFNLLLLLLQKLYQYKGEVPMNCRLDRRLMQPIKITF